MLIRVLIITLLVLTGSHAGLAAVSLSVNPVNGTNSLRFERIPVAGSENKQEIHIRVISTSGARYQVFQRVLEPIVNEKGDNLNLQAITVQTLSNSNSYGTLYLENSGQLSMSDQLLYSSSQSGTNDAFIIGYALDRNLVNAGGSFRGRLDFTVRGSDGSSDEVSIDVFLQTSPSLKISIKGAHGFNRIHVRSSDTTDRTADYLNISFSGNLGQEIRIYQQVETFPTNNMDEELGADVLQVDAQGQTDGLRIEGPSSLSNNRSLIYSSNKNQDSFNLYFLANADKLQQQDSGVYNGRIMYVVQTDHGRQEFPIDIQFDVPPEFTLTVAPPPGGVSFTQVLANNPPQDKNVIITVFSNLHKPYQVIQDLQTNMTNQQGKEFSSKYFTMQVQIPPGQRGQTDFTEFSPAQTGEYPVYSSDARGSGTTFVVVYRLQGYAQMSPGDFTAPVRFSLNQK